MHILKVTQAYFPFLEKGGPTVKVRALARGLAQAGHRVTVLTADLGFDDSARQMAGVVPGRWGYEMQEGAVQTVYLRTAAHYRAVTWNRGTAAFCRERLREVDVAHIYGLYDLLGPVAARECRRAHKPYVVEPMGMFVPIVRNLLAKRLYHSMLGSAMLAGAARIIATAEQERQELLEGGIPEKKVVVRRNGISVPDQFPERGSFRQRWNVLSNSILVLFLGRLVSKKSPDLLMQAFGQWRKANHQRPSVLVLAGPDEDGFRERLESLAGQMGLRESVLFTGPLYGDAKWSAYRDADVFVLPSQNENFGNTAAEAVACGTPVVVTDQCGIAPIVKDRAGLVVSHSAQAIETGLSRILDDEAFSARLRSGCPEVARALGWAEPLAEMETVYRQVIGEGAAT